MDKKVILSPEIRDTVKKDSRLIEDFAFEEGINSISFLH